MKEIADGYSPVEIIHKAGYSNSAHDDKCVDGVVSELHELFGIIVVRFEQVDR